MLTEKVRALESENNRLRSVIFTYIEGTNDDDYEESFPLPALEAEVRALFDRTFDPPLALVPSQWQETVVRGLIATASSTSQTMPTGRLARIRSVSSAKRDDEGHLLDPTPHAQQVSVSESSNKELSRTTSRTGSSSSLLTSGSHKSGGSSHASSTEHRPPPTHHKARDHVRLFRAAWAVFLSSYSWSS